MNNQLNSFEEKNRKVESSEKKISQIFEKMFHKGIAVKENKRLSATTIKTYEDMTLSIFREINNKFGVEQIFEVKEEHINQIVQERIEKYHNGELKQAWNLKTMCAALKAFNLGVQETNIYKEKFTLGDPDLIRETLKEKNIVRKSKSTSVLNATPEECKSVLENIRNKGYDTDTREMAYHLGKIALETGGRISATIKLRVSDISIDKDKRSITFKGDKGGLTRTVQISEETAEYLELLMRGKKDNQLIFSSKRLDGTFKPVEETRKELSKIFKQAGEHLTRNEEIQVKDKDGNKKIVEVKKTFSAHSFRKAFTLDRAAQYFQSFSSKSAIDKYVSERIKDNPKLKDKLDMVRARINKDRNTPRDLDRMEYAIFFASVDLGHFRNDVITAFYATKNDVQKYLEGKK